MAIQIVCDGRDRDEWIRARRNAVCASEVPILFGCGYAGTSLRKLYLEKIGEPTEATEETEGMKLGKRLESSILDELAERAELGQYQDEWYGNHALLCNSEHHFLFATPDGMTRAGEPIEVKNICNRLNDEDWDGTIPRRFMIQVQSQIAVCGAERGLFGALLFGGKLVWSWIYRDDELIAEIKRRVSDFWSLVENREPPASEGNDSSRKASLAIAETLSPVELFEGDIQHLLVAWEQAKSDESSAKNSLKHSESWRKSVEDELIVRMGSATKARTVTGWEFEKTTTNKREYMVKATTIHGFRVKPPKE